MTRNCKPMCFVADSLNQMQGGRIGRQYRGQFLAHQEQALLTRSAVCAFRNAGDPESFDLELLEYSHRFVQLRGAAIDQQQIRHWDLALLDSSVASSERLSHRAVIIARCDVIDIEATIVGLERAFGSEYDARSDGPFAHRVTDVETF